MSCYGLDYKLLFGPPGKSHSKFGDTIIGGQKCEFIFDNLSNAQISNIALHLVIALLTLIAKDVALNVFASFLVFGL